MGIKICVPDYRFYIPPIILVRSTRGRFRLADGATARTISHTGIGMRQINKRFNK